MSAPGSEEDTKPVIAQIRLDEYVTLKVQDQGGRRFTYAMRTTDKLQALIDQYYARVPSVEYGTGSFWFDGTRLLGGTTPAELEMEDGDEIDYFHSLLGGSDARLVLA